MIEQAIRDYTNLSRSIVPIEVEYYETASSLLFEEGYLIAWGELEINMEDIMNYLSIDKAWFDRKLVELVED